MAPRSPRTVLIVDDNVGLAENIAEILQLDGYVTSVAASAEEALAILVVEHPEIVVTDYRLPGIDGASLVKRLRAMGVRARAIVISAFTDERTIEAAESVGASFVAKPVDFATLGQLLEESGRAA